MTADQDKCGLSSLLPMSCRGRAEAFARRLHSRLKSLGSQDENGVADEHSWLASHENSVSISQPRHTDSDLYLDFDTLESPGSPQEETPHPEFINLINNTDNLSCKDEIKCSKTKGLTQNRLPSNDSDSSDGTFYDLDFDTESKAVAKQINGDIVTEYEVTDSQRTEKSQIDSDNNNVISEHYFVTPLSAQCLALLNSLSLSEDSTLSLPYEECISSVPESPGDCSKEQNGIYPTPEEESISTECTDYAKVNGNAKEEDTVKGKEVYVSHINVEKDLVVECSFTSEVSILPTVEVSGEQLQSTPSEGDETELDERTPRVRRCSSLKTGKTPPGTPGRKKIVRFADVLGLDLADVRTFLDEIPKIPNSAYEDLKDADLTESTSDCSLNSLCPDQKFLFSVGPKSDKILVILFQQPGGMPNFLERVKEQQVCLENALVADPVALSVSGTVRVRNLDFNKSVHIRYSLDCWKTFADLQAVYVPNSCDGFSDKFSFLLYANNLSVGQRLEFAIRFQCKGCQYWDNNNGANYCFQCLPASNNNSVAPITSSSNDWSGSFY